MEDQDEVLVCHVSEMVRIKVAIFTGVIIVHVFDLSTSETEAGGSMNSRPSRTT